MENECPNNSFWIKEILMDMLNQFHFTEEYIQSKNFNYYYHFTQIKYIDLYELNLITNKKQNGGDLCGFHCFFNIVYFLKYLQINDSENEKEIAKCLLKLNSTVKFWKMYNKTLKILSETKEVNQSDMQILMSEGALERYQFKILLDNYHFKAQKNIKFYSFFFAFNFIQGMSKTEVIELQNALDDFKNYSENEKLVYFILMGITNHWSILVLEK